jgi:hypothetical protein
MEGSQPFEVQLASSDAFRAFRAEHAVVEAAREHRWPVSHGPLYLDSLTNKLRELDVAGRRIWKKPRKSGEIYARVHLLVEVKSASGYHVLCAGAAPWHGRFGENEYWIGYCEQSQRAMASVAEEFGLTPEQTREFIHKAEKICFPRHTMLTSVLRICPMPVEHCYSAFREANLKAEKELDNSVLWRAVSALRSAIASERLASIEAVVSDLRIDMEVARRHKKPISTYTFGVESRGSAIDLYIPVVVIGSRLWSAAGASPEELKWFRLVEKTLSGDSTRWTDVVNERYFGDYLARLGDHLGRQFKRARAKERVPSLSA